MTRTTSISMPPRAASERLLCLANQACIVNYLLSWLVLFFDVLSLSDESPRRSTGS
jgi:hypothetical protein